MDQVEIETFLTVINCHNYTKAAEMLFSTQTTISHRIASLENELGYSILERYQGLRNIKLTPQGEQFLPIAEQLQALWNKSRVIKSSNFKDLLNIGGTNRLNTHFLLPFYQFFSSQDMHIQPTIRSYHSSEIGELIDQKELDIGFVSTEAQIKAVITKPFLKEQIVMVCHRGKYYSESCIHPESLDVSKEVRLAMNPEIQNWHNYWWDRFKQPYIYADTAMISAYFLTDERLWSICPLSVAKSLIELYPVEIHEFSVEVPYQVSYIMYPQYPRLGKEKIIRDFLTSFQNYYHEKKIDSFLL